MTRHAKLGAPVGQTDAPGMADLFRRHDWGTTPLGRRDTWAPVLRTTVDLILASLHPMCLLWGPERVLLYNDGYAEMLGTRHPHALGRPTKAVWPELWAELAPLIERTFRGESFAFRDQPLTMTRNGFAEPGWYDFAYSPVRDEHGAVVGLLNVTSDSTARRHAIEQMRERETFMRGVLAASNDCIKVLDLDAKLTFMSEGGQKVMEVSDFNAIAGCPWPNFWEGVGNIAAKKAIASARAGVASGFQGYADTAKGTRRFWDVQVSPILGPEGTPERILSISRDITDLKAAEEARAVLAQELAHRMKNSLAMVQAIVTQTLRQAKSTEEGRTAISERLSALGRAQDILTLSNFTEANIHEVIAAATAPHRVTEDRITWSGPALTLTSQQALGLSLATHELATNAAKYGALSNDVGRVVMAWRIEAGAFAFEWNETDGPPVVPPSSRGFGSKLIERIVASYFDGEGRLDFAPSGVRFRLTGAPGGISAGE